MFLRLLYFNSQYSLFFPYILVMKILEKNQLNKILAKFEEESEELLI